MISWDTDDIARANSRPLRLPYRLSQGQQISPKYSCTLQSYKFITKKHSLASDFIFQPLLYHWAFWKNTARSSHLLYTKNYGPWEAIKLRYHLFNHYSFLWGPWQILEKSQGLCAFFSVSVELTNEWCVKESRALCLSFIGVSNKWHDLAQALNICDSPSFAYISFLSKKIYYG